MLEFPLYEISIEGEYMPKLNTPWRLASFIGALVVIFVNIISATQENSMVFIINSAFGTTYVKPSLEWLTQWSSIITVVVIFGLIIWAIINYFINRNKPDEESDRVQAMKDLAQEMKRMNDRNEQINNQIK
jgi:uncharacterized membrane protein (DUF106 family)